MRSWGMTLLLGLGVIGVSQGIGKAEAVGIYGEDDRRDLFEIPVGDTTHLLARASAAMIAMKDVQVDPNTGTTVLKSKNYGESERLCAGTRFEEQPTAGHCSATLVGPDLVMTAGHCVETMEKCSRVGFLFDYSVSEKGKNPSDQINPENLYTCKSIVKSALKDQWINGKRMRYDYALVELDRVVQGRPNLERELFPKLKEGDKLTMIGYPMGLPMKITAGSVRQFNPKLGYFVTDLDAYGGNSGSAVISDEGKIVGVLVRGKQDLEFDEKLSCYKDKVFEAADYGEDVSVLGRLFR